MVAAHAQAAHDLATELEQWTSRRIDYFRALESMPYERVHMDRAAVAARELYGTLVAPIERLGAAYAPVPFATELENVLYPGAESICGAVRRIMGAG